MRKEDLISVIIPVYNVEEFLTRCLDSVLNQTYSNLEIILINDGSTDDSGNICNEYALKDKRIIVIHKENGGLSDARNSGLNLAKGEYISFIDSDDFISINFFKILHKELVQSNSDVSFCYFRMYYEGDSFSDNFDENYKVESYSKNQIFNNFYSYAFSLEQIVVWNKLYKKEIWNNIRFPVGRFHEDEFVVHEIFYNTEKFCVVNLAMYYYYQRSGSITTLVNNQIPVVRALDYLDSLEGRVEFGESKELNKFVRDTILKKKWWLIQNYEYIPKEVRMKIKNEIKKDFFKVRNESFSEKIKSILIVCFPMLLLALRKKLN